jgi:hypothetical protein
MKKLILFLLFSITVQQHCFAESPDYGNVAIFLDHSERVKFSYNMVSLPVIAAIATKSIIYTPKHFAFILSALVFKNVIDMARIEYERTGETFLFDSLEQYKIFVSRDRRFFILTAADYEKTTLKFIDENKIEATDLSHFMQGFEVTDAAFYGAADLISLCRNDAIPLNVYLEGHGSYGDQSDQLVCQGRIFYKNLAGSVAGLDMIGYMQLIDHFKTLNINLLYVSGRHADGGFNMKTPYFCQVIGSDGDIIAGREKLNFTVILGVIPDTPIYLPFGGRFNNYFFEPPVDESYSLNNFFKHTSNKKIYNEEELKNMLRPITPRIRRIFNDRGISRLAPNITALPNIYFPDSENFTSLFLYDNVGMLTEAKAKKHEKEGRSLLFVEKDVVAIYPTEIRAPLKIEQDSLYCFGITIMRSGSVLTKINKLSFDRSFRELIFAFAFGQSALEKDRSNSVKCVYIRSLITQDKQLFNVMFCFKTDSVYVVYTDKNNSVKADHFKLNGLELTAQRTEPAVFKNFDGPPQKTFIGALYKYREISCWTDHNLGFWLNEEILGPIISLLSHKERTKLSCYGLESD